MAILNIKNSNTNKYRGPIIQNFTCQLHLSSIIMPIDAPPSSLMDSIVNPKVKTVEGKGIGACSLARNTLKVEGRVGALRWD